MVRVKFCGLTRVEDVAAAERLGAAYVGAVFAGGPRLQTLDSAARLFAGVQRAQRVGVVGSLDGLDLAAVVAGTPLDVVQLHADPSPDDVVRARAAGARTVWAVVRIDGTPRESGAMLPDGIAEVFRAADAVVLDTRSPTTLGGTGMTFPWEPVAEELAAIRGETPVVVAGGLTPENIGYAVRALQPSVVDVSSGVESAPGIKDHARMQRFVDVLTRAVELYHI